MCMENHDRYLEVVWGCHYAGLVYTCASSRLQSSELEYIINDCGARAYITSKYKADQAAEIVAATPGVELRLRGAGVGAIRRKFAVRIVTSASRGSRFATATATRNSM